MTRFYERVAQNESDIDSNNNALENPTQMSDAVATRLGYKQYEAGVDGPDITGFGDTSTVNDGLDRGLFIPYQTQNGDWWCRFSIAGTLDSAGTSCTVTMTGMTFKDSAAGLRHAISVNTNSSTNANLAGAFAQENGSFIEAGSTVNRSGWIFSGDVPLESKPSWAV